MSLSNPKSSRQKHFISPYHHFHPYNLEIISFFHFDDNSSITELDEPSPTNDTNGDDDDNEVVDEAEEDSKDTDAEPSVGQITLQNGNRIDRGSAGALTKSRLDPEIEDQVIINIKLINKNNSHYQKVI